MVNIHKIRLLAAEKGVKLSFLISKIGLKSRTYFQDVEKRNSDIPEDKLQIIAHTLGTTVEYLRDETDDPNKNNSADKLLPDILYRVSELSDDKQKEIFAFIEFKLHQQDEENK